MTGNHTQQQLCIWPKFRATSMQSFQGALQQTSEMIPALLLSAPLVLGPICTESTLPCRLQTLDLVVLVGTAVAMQQHGLQQLVQYVELEQRVDVSRHKLRSLT